MTKKLLSSITLSLLFAPAFSAAQFRAAPRYQVHTPTVRAFSSAAALHSSLRPASLTPAVSLIPSAITPAAPLKAAKALSVSMPFTAAAAADQAPVFSDLPIGEAWSRSSTLFDGLKAGKALPIVSPVYAQSPLVSRPFSRLGRSISDMEALGAKEGFVPAAPPELPGRTPLEKHVAFFDINGDGVITVGETRRRLRQLGFGRIRAAVLSAAIHAGLSFSTRDSWKDAVLLRIRVKNIHKGIHTGDTGVYDENGEFVPSEFERLFSTFAKSSPDSLTETEFQDLIEANAQRRPGALGKFAAKQEFGLLLEIAADGEQTVDGKTLKTISRARMRAFYDGSLLYILVGERLP